MELKRVVVTGLGAITPLGLNVDDTWNALLEGKSGCGPITQFNAEKFKTQIACEVKGFDPMQYFEKKEVRKVDRYAQLGFAAVAEAIKDCGIDLETADKNRIGVVFSAGIGGLKTLHEEINAYNAEVGPRYNPFFIPKIIGDICAGQISIHYGFHGPNYGTVSACATSTHALLDAFNLLRLGKADMIVTGGAEAAICEPGVGGFNSMKALSTRNDDPTHASRPFSASRDGFVMGEGAAVVVLEELEHAKKRGAKIYAEVLGYGCTSDAYHITSPAEDGMGAANAMLGAVKDAGLNKEDIMYINAHGTSTHHNDLFETRAIKAAFGDHAKNIKVNSTKSMIGHLLGAAGAVEFIACVKSVEEGYIHQTVGLQECEEEMDLDYCKESFTGDVPYALSNSLGFGGHNASIIVGKYNE